MKIVIHDYAGHPFQIDLSRELSRKGYVVYHLYTNASGGPKGGLSEKNENLKIINVDSTKIEKQNFIKRRTQEIQYGKSVVNVLKEIKPDIVISANTPLDAQKKIMKWCDSESIKFIFWLQDIISIAAESILKKN